MITKNVHLLPKKHLSAWRKISIGSWRPNGDSQVYCEIRVSAEKALKKIAEQNQKSDTKITMTHFTGLVMGKALKEVPDLNAIVRFANIYPRRDVDIFFHVAHGDTDLSGHIVRNIDQKSMKAIAQEMAKGAKDIRTDQDASFKKIKNSWKYIPSFLAGSMLNLINFISYTLNINIKGMGVPRDCFGSMMITNIGSLGFSQAFVPLAPYTSIPLILALGKTELRPVCQDDGKIISEQQISLCFTFDHRIMDGARGAKMTEAIQKYFSHPELLD